MHDEPIIWICVAVFCILIFGIINNHFNPPPPGLYTTPSRLNTRYISDNTSETTADESEIESEC